MRGCLIVYLFPGQDVRRDIRGKDSARRGYPGLDQIVTRKFPGIKFATAKNFQEMAVASAAGAGFIGAEAAAFTQSGCPTALIDAQTVNTVRAGRML